MNSEQNNLTPEGLNTVEPVQPNNLQPNPSPTPSTDVQPNVEPMNGTPNVTHQPSVAPVVETPSVTQPNTFQTNLEQPNQTMNMANETNYNSETEGKKSKLPLIILLVVLLAGLAVAAYYFLGQNKSNTEILSASANKQIANFSKMINSVKSVDVLSNVAKNKGTAKLHLELNSTSPLLSGISGYKLDLNAGFDSANNKVALDADIANSTNDKFGMKFRGLNDKLYVDLGDIFDKNIIISDFSTDGLFDQSLTQPSALVQDIDVDDYAYLAEVAVKAVTDTIKENELVKTNVNVKVYEDTLSLTKMSYNLTKERMNLLVKAILNSIKADQKALNILAKTNEEINTSDAWITEINKMLAEENFVSDDFTEATISFFINNKLELVMTEIDDTESTVTLIAYKEKYTIKSTSKTNSNETFEIYYDDKENDVVRFKMNMEGTLIDITITIDDKSSGDTAAADITINGSLTSEGQAINFTAQINFELNEEYNFNAPNTATAVNYEQLTPMEIYTIEANIANNPIGAIFLSLFQSMEF